MSDQSSSTRSDAKHARQTYIEAKQKVVNYDFGQCQLFDYFRKPDTHI